MASGAYTKINTLSIVIIYFPFDILIKNAGNEGKTT